MMKNLSFLFFVTIMVFVTITTSCKKEEESVDVRIQSYGNYHGSIKFYKKSSMAIVSDTTIDYSIIENPNDNHSILFMSDSQTILKGSKIAEASNGFTFDIESQSFIDPDGNTVTIVGDNYVELDGTKYHGMYNSSTHKSMVAFTFSSDGVTVLGVLEGTK